MGFEPASSLEQSSIYTTTPVYFIVYFLKTFNIYFIIIWHPEIFFEV